MANRRDEQQNEEMAEAERAQQARDLAGQDFEPTEAAQMRRAEQSVIEKSAEDVGPDANADTPNPEAALNRSNLKSDVQSKNDGPQLEPQPGGPQSAGPQSAGPQSAGPESGGPQLGGPQAQPNRAPSWHPSAQPAGPSAKARPAPQPAPQLATPFAPPTPEAGKRK